MIRFSCKDKIKSQYETIGNNNREDMYENKRISMIGPFNLLAYAWHVSYTLKCKPQGDRI
jgi:hypothetical protein